MKRKKVNRRRSALRWLAALAAVTAIVIAAEPYCFTSEQALQKMGRYYDVGELELLETMDGQRFRGLFKPDEVYILQNQAVTGLAFGNFHQVGGWSTYFPKFLEHGEQPSVPVDCLMDFVQLGAEDGSLLLKNFILGIILDPAAESVELRLGNYVWEEDAATLVTTTTVSVPKEDWQEGPYYDWFFYMFDPVDPQNGIELRALDQNEDPITWTDLEGNQVEWYNSRWPRDYYEDGWWRLNGERP